MRSREEVRQKMFDLIAQWKTSGLSQKAFCLEQQVHYYVFHYWYKRYREAHPQDPLDCAGADTASSFIPLSITTSLPAVFHTELIYPDGRRLLFHQPVDARFLKAIIE